MNGPFESQDLPRSRSTNSSLARILRVLGALFILTLCAFAWFQDDWLVSIAGIYILVLEVLFWIERAREKRDQNK